jgi:hypothetical protein
VDWTALAAWIYLDSTVDWAKVDRYKISTVYIDPRSGNASEVRDDIRAHGKQCGAYTVAAWKPDLGGAAFSVWTSQRLQALLPRQAGSEAAPYMADLEAVSQQYQRDFLTDYRRRQPARPSSYTNEPWKDGTVVPIPELVKSGFHWYPQLYYGGMSPADGAGVVLEVCRWGFPADRVHPFYDGARLPLDRRDGCVFTLERLP